MWTLCTVGDVNVGAKKIIYRELDYKEIYKDRNGSDTLYIVVSAVANSFAIVQKRLLSTERTLEVHELILVLEATSPLYSVNNTSRSVTLLLDIHV